MLQPALHRRALGASLKEREHDYWTHSNVAADLRGRLDRKENCVSMSAERKCQNLEMSRRWLQAKSEVGLAPTAPPPPLAHLCCLRSCARELNLTTLEWETSSKEQRKM